MEFVSIPPGEFMMGCSPNDDRCGADENPRHRVQISKAFEIGKYEVTQAQWVALTQTNPSGSKGDMRPVETVSKLEAQDFVAKLNAAADGYRYRLPTEAEWEYAARAGMDAAYSGSLDQVAWYAANSDDETHPVGQKKPNAWGLYDVQGNVREWVSDLYSANYYNNSPAIDPAGPPRGAALGVDRVVDGVAAGVRARSWSRAGRATGFRRATARALSAARAAARRNRAAANRCAAGQVADLQRQLEQLRNDIAAGGPPPQGPRGPDRIKISIPSTAFPGVCRLFAAVDGINRRPFSACRPGSAITDQRCG